MAVTKIWTIKDSLQRVLDYAANPDKTEYDALAQTLHYAENDAKTKLNESAPLLTGIPKLKELTDAIHAEGGKAGIQLWQGGLAVGMDQTAMILLSSDTELAPGFTVPGISKEMIAEVVDCYGKAAARAVAAGFDCIEFHCAHNYLPHSFLSDGLNHRTDEYGGNLENRARFPLACIRAIRAAMPEGMPLFMRIDAQDDGFGEAGLTMEDTITFCNWAKDAGVDVLDVSRGNIVTAASKYEVQRDKPVRQGADPGR